MTFPSIRAFLAPAVLLLSAGFAHAEPGVTEKAIVVGQSAVFSGQVAETGNNYRRGIELYFEQANRAGGVHGRKLQLVFSEGLRRAGRAPTREGLVAALEGMGKLDIGDFVVEYGPTNHNGSGFVELEMYTAAGDLVR